MSRLIDADALTEIIHGMYAEGDDPSTYHVDVEGDTLIGKFAVVDAIFNMPTIQPEIVRCGECKWFQCNMRPDGYLPQGVNEFECRHWCGSCDPTDFCSYAERREVTT